MNKLSKLVTFTGLIFASCWLTVDTANAFEFSLENQSGNNYSYSVALDIDDSLDIGDQLILTNLSGVIAVSSNSPYTLDGFDPTSANFSVSTAANGAADLTSVISLTSADSLSGLEYQAFFTDNGTPNVVSGSVTAVPFKPEANLGILLLLGGFGLRKLKRRFS